MRIFKWQHAGLFLFTSSILFLCSVPAIGMKNEDDFQPVVRNSEGEKEKERSDTPQLKEDIAFCAEHSRMNPLEAKDKLLKVDSCDLPKHLGCADLIYKLRIVDRGELDEELEDIPTVFSLLKRFPNLIDLNLMECKRIDKVILEDFPKDITILNLSYCHPLVDDICKRLPEGLIALHLDKTALTDRGFRFVVNQCPELATLTLSGCTEITDFSDLQMLTKLSKLDLGNTHVNDKGLLALPESLKKLSLRNTQLLEVRPLITNESLRIVAHRCPNLNVLDLRDSMEIADFSVLQRFSNLTELNLAYTRIDNDGLQYLPRSLNKLSVRCTQIISKDGCQITGAGLIPSTSDGVEQIVARCPNLIELDLGVAGINDIPDLEKLAHLVELNLENAHVTDQALQHLPRSLNKLNLLGTPITDEGIKTIAEACAKLTHLDLGLSNVSSKGDDLITSKGLEYLPESLTTLRLSHLNIKDLSSLKRLSNLQTLVVESKREKRVLEGREAILAYIDSLNQ